VAAGASVEPTRPFMPALPGWVGPLVYVATALMVLVVAHDATVRLRRYGVSWRALGGELWRRIVEDPRRLGTLIAETFGQQRSLRDREAGAMHALIFGALVLTTLGTSLVGLDHDIARPLGVSFLRGDFYLGCEVVLDTAGLMLLVGVLWAACGATFGMCPGWETCAASGGCMRGCCTSWSPRSCWRPRACWCVPCRGPATRMWGGP